MSNGSESVEARLIGNRIRELEGLSFGEVAALSAADGSEVLVAGRTCSLTTFVQQIGAGQLLATVQLSRSVAAGLMQIVQERGLVFLINGSVREATPDELMNSGG